MTPNWRGYGEKLSFVAPNFPDDDLGEGARVRLVVMEFGASGLATHAAPDGSGHTVVVAGRRDEAPAIQFLRALGRSRGLERCGQHVVLTVLALAHRFDAEVTAARLMFARALMIHAAAAQPASSELLLSAGDEACSDAHAGLVALVDSVMGQPGSAVLPIRVRFARSSVRSAPSTEVASFGLRGSGRPPVFRAQPWPQRCAGH